MLLSPAIERSVRPDVSIIIAARRIDGAEVRPCLASLHSQTFDGSIEAIVVEGGNIAQARNEGLRTAEGKYIAFIDSDCTATKDWLRILIINFKSLVNVGGVGGVGVSPKEKDIFTESIDTIYQSYLGSLGSASLYVPRKTVIVKSLSTHNSIFHADVLRDVNGFDERYLMNEDTNLSLKVRKKGSALYLVPNAVVYHKRKSSFTTFSKTFFQWGVSRTRSVLTDLNHFDLRIFALFTLFLLNMLLLLFNHALFSLVLVSIYFIILFVHSIYYTLKKKKIRLLFYVPALYLMQHISYALGLFYGCFIGGYDAPEPVKEFRVHHEVIK